MIIANSWRKLLWVVLESCHESTFFLFMIDSLFWIKSKVTDSWPPLSKVKSLNIALSIEVWIFRKCVLSIFLQWIGSKKLEKFRQKLLSNHNLHIWNRIIHPLFLCMSFYLHFMVHSEFYLFYGFKDMFTKNIKW